MSGDIKFTPKVYHHSVEYLAVVTPDREGSVCIAVDKSILFVNVP